MDEFEKAVSEIDERNGNVNDENVFEIGNDIIDFSPNSRSLVTATLSSARKWRNRILELSKEHPEECEIVHTNKDGSIVAHFPCSYLHIYRPRELSEETKEKYRENLKRVKAK